MKTLKLLLALAILPGILTVRAGTKVGDAFPSLAAADVSGALPETKGQVVFVDFWASWCAPCKASFPAYGRIFSAYAPKGLVIVAVSVDESGSAYAGFVKRNAPPFPTVRDQHQSLVRQVQVPTMPTSYLIGRDGRVRYMHVGYHGAQTERELRAEIDTLLAEKS